MTNPIKFSVIIPVYNVKDYLSECLDSIVGQTLTDIEIICVDNGSMDESLEILKKYAKRDKRIKILEIGRSNAGAARNAGLAVANGEFLYFIDSDDYCETDLLEKCYKKITEDKADVLVFRASMFDTTTKKHEILSYSLVDNNLPTKIPFKPAEMKNHLFNSFQNWPWDKVFRHEFIKEKNISFQEVVRANDVMFVYLALAQAKKITILDDVLIHYRVGNKNSLQATNHLAPVAFWDAYRKTKEMLTKVGVYDVFERTYLNETMKGILYNYHSVKTKEAKEYIYALIRYGAEIEFSFMKHDKKYYEDKNAYDEFREIVESSRLSDLEVQALQKEYEILKLKNKELEKTKAQLENGIKEIRESGAYKAGMAITSVPRKIKSLIK
jgi:glycosyltransferase involved in cell wall biosynthesis